MFGIGVIELLIIIPLSLAPWFLGAWFIRYLVEMSRERRRLRLEISKLAHELEGLRADRDNFEGQVREPSS